MMAHMFEWLENTGQSLLSGAEGLGHAVADGASAAAHSAGEWLGHGADASNPVTAESANAHAAAAQPDSLWGRLGQSVGDLGRGLEQEGLGGLLDPGGMIDRQQAQRDLAGRFQVVGDDFVGPRRDNQVSQEEFQRIAHTFSDVRMGRGDLHVDSSSFDGPNRDADRARYEQGSMDMIANMMMTQSGRGQIENLHDNVLRDDAGDARTTWYGAEQHHQTTLVPLFGVDNGRRDANGAVLYDDPGAGNHNTSTLRQDNGYADAVDTTRMQRNADGTRGDGTDVNIRWNPESNNIGGQGARSDIILAHEMEHTVNETQGTMARGLYGNNPDGSPRADSQFQNWERQAVGLTRSDSPTGGHYPGDPDGCTENTYRAQRNALGLGERWLPRTAYGSLPGQAADDASLQTAWNNHNTSGNAAP